MDDVLSLLDRLIFEGKIKKILNPSPKASSSSAVIGYIPGASSDSGGEWTENEEALDIWMYLATPSTIQETEPWTEMPCGKCPQFYFCTKDGPVNPNNCVYFQQYLQF